MSGVNPPKPPQHLAPRIHDTPPDRPTIGLLRMKVEDVTRLPVAKKKKKKKKDFQLPYGLKMEAGRVGPRNEDGERRPAWGDSRDAMQSGRFVQIDSKTGPAFSK